MMTGLTCGAAREVITPPEELLSHLRGLRDSTFGGVLDDLYVRVIAVGSGLDKALLIAFDLDKAPYPAESLARITTHTGIPEANICFFSTHTHTAPVTGFRPEEPINDIRLKAAEVQTATAKYEQLVTEMLFKAVDAAISSMKPAKMGYAYGESHINVNRVQEYECTDEKGQFYTERWLGVNHQAPVDRTLFVMKFEDMNGQPIAFFMNYPVHNCVLICNLCCNKKMGVSGDFIGELCRLLEAKFDGSTAVWSSGAAGDVNPILLNEIIYPDPKTGRAVETHMGEGIKSVMHMLSARHFADVMKAVRKISCSTDTLAIAGTVDWVFTPGRNVVTREDGSSEIAVGEGVDPYEIRLHLLQLNDIALLGFSGELYSSLGRQLQEISPVKNTLLINHDASLMARSGYIFDDEALACDTSNRLPGRKSSHMLPGYVSRALEKQTLAMFGKLKHITGE